jgi:hypothetical protein
MSDHLSVLAIIVASALLNLWLWRWSRWTVVSVERIRPATSLSDRGPYVATCRRFRRTRTAMSEMGCLWIWTDTQQVANISDGASVVRMLDETKAAQKES